ncbi:Lrp/AsnC family transcriptional regulator [Candidatus Woesearchaeota archaeon]|nr:Lrp/AsnC family transcriptional regulator [Candidatus Woesearchaeota archaeon]
MEESNFRGQIYDKAVPKELDLIDRKILYLLCKNARFSNTVIAKNLNLSREVVSYRIKRMEDSDFLKGCITLIDPRKLGFIEIIVYFKLISLNNEKEVIEFITNKKGIVGVKTCSGKYDLQIIFSAKELENIHENIRELLEKYNNIISNYDVLTIVDMNFLGMGLILEKDAEQINIIKDSKGSSFLKEFLEISKKDYVPNKADKNIMEIIQSNARISIVEISKETSLSPITVKNKISNLVNCGIIKSFVPYFTMANLGYQWYEIFFRFKDFNERKFIEYIKQHKNIVWYVKFIGKWDYQISVFAKNHSHFHEILNEFRNEFNDSLSEYESVIVFNQFAFKRRIE